MEILEPFKAWSLRLQGKCANDSIFDIFPAMDDLLTSLENARTRYNLETHSHHLRTSIDTVWALLNKYSLSSLSWFFKKECSMLIIIDTILSQHWLLFTMLQSPYTLG